MWLQEALNILEEQNIKDIKLNTKGYTHLVTAAIRLAYFDLLSKTIVSKEYRKERAKIILLDKVIPEVMSGDLAVTRHDTTAEEGKHTSHISIIDKEGNIISLTTTLGNLFDCVTAIDGMGFTFNSGDIEKAKKYLSKSIECYIQCSLAWGKSMPYAYCSQIYFMDKDYNKAIEYLKLAMEYSQNLGSDYEIGIILRISAQIVAEKKNNDEVRKVFHEFSSYSCEYYINEAKGKLDKVFSPIEIDYILKLE